MFEFAMPWVFLLLPLPILIRQMMPAAQPKQTVALKVPFFQLIRSFNRKSTSKLSPLKKLSMILLWCLLITAAADPRWLGKSIPITRHGRDILMAIDISPSMKIRDMAGERYYVPRIQVVKEVASRFISRRKGDKIGILLFATKPYLLTPLTFDHKTAVSMLQDSTIGLAGKATAIGSAIGLAIKRLRDQPEASRVLILLTDGADNASRMPPEQAAQLAAENHIRIYTIGIGSRRGYQLPGGLAVRRYTPSVSINEASLKEIASTTGGRYFRATDAQELDHIYHLLDKLEPVSTDQEYYRPIKPLYPWPLGASLFISLLLVLSYMKFKPFTTATKVS